MNVAGGHISYCWGNPWLPARNDSPGIDMSFWYCQVSYHLLTNWWFVTAALSAHLAQICWVDAPDSDPGETTIQGLVWSCWLSCISEFNPLSPNIHKQILQTDLYTFPYRISWEKLIKDQRFFCLWSLINSHRCCTWQSMDTVRRKFMLVTIGT